MIILPYSCSIYIGFIAITNFAINLVTEPGTITPSYVYLFISRQTTRIVIQLNQIGRIISRGGRFLNSIVWSCEFHYWFVIADIALAVFIGILLETVRYHPAIVFCTTYTIVVSISVVDALISLAFLIARTNYFGD